MPEEKETELVHRAASGDIEAKLQLVKEHLGLVVELAAGYASETGNQFSQVVKEATLAVIRAADDFHVSQQIRFVDHVRHEFVKAMKGVG